MNDKDTDRCAVCGKPMTKDGEYRHVQGLKRLNGDQPITMRWAPLCKTHLVECDTRQQSR